MLTYVSCSLIAVLEAFVYDPLLSWRLLKYRTKGPKTPADFSEGNIKTDTADKPMPNIQNVAALPSQNRQAYELVRRVEHKLKGREFRTVSI